MNYLRKTLLFFTFSLFYINLSAQDIYTITGKVTDASSGEAVPFAAVTLKGTKSGTTTNFEGFYTLKTKLLSDSLGATFLGYKTRMKGINKALKTQKIDFQLDGSSFQLTEVIVHAGENPAWQILRKVVDNKEVNNKKKFTAYEYESYVRTEIDIDKISDNLKKQKFIGQIAGAIDKIQKLAGEDGKPYLPVFVSETVSDVYFRDNPKKTKEAIKKQQITGVGFVENDVVSQLLGSSFQEYNFYDNYMRILTKDFVSPIADGWRQNYDYYLKDSTLVGENFCYVIEFDPKNKLDLAFTGQMWIDSKTFAIAQINAQIGKESNLNFIEKIKIQQEFEQIEGKAWLPIQNRVVFNVAEITPNSAGFIAKFFSANKNIIINKPRVVSFFELPIEVANDSKDTDETYWLENRPTPLSKEEKSVYSMIDTVKNLPIIKQYTKIINIATTGHVKVGVIDIGPWPFAYAYNNFEGNRFRLGFRTNTDFSRKWYLKSYVAYGTHDKKLKYGLDITRVLATKHYSGLTAYYNYDAEQMGINYDDLGLNYLTNTLFRGFSHFGTFRRPYYIGETGLTVNIDPSPGLSFIGNIKNRNFSPNYPFAFRSKPEDGVLSPIKNDFSTTELSGEMRYARGEITVRNNRNRKVKIRKAKEYPVISVKYVLGVKALGGKFEYHKFSLNIQKSIRMGIVGRTESELSIGYTPSTIPYPLLFPHQGNMLPIYIINAYNMMNYFEFISDRYAAFRFQHNFEGLITNRLPLIKKLNLRTHLTGRILFGSASKANQDIIPSKLIDGEEVPRFGTLNATKPYIETGYGVSNLFKCVRIDFLHRLTYLDNKNAHKFGVKVSLELKL